MVLLVTIFGLIAGCCCLPPNNCVKGYIEDDKDGCCPDLDGNKICDWYESTHATTKVTTTRISTTTKATTRISTTTLTIPKDETSCKSAGGLWGAIGLSPVESCNMPTSDAGKECSSQSDCEGACLVELTAEQKEKVIAGTVVETTGTCTPYWITVGCRAFVEDGKIENIICID